MRNHKNTDIIRADLEKPDMTQSISIQLDEALIDRTMRLAAKRGISVDQLISQQLERAVAQDEYTRLQHKVEEHRKLNRPTMPSPRAAKRRS
jgi:hypothetical protein